MGQQPHARRSDRPAASSSAGSSVGSNIAELVAAGYGVISFDQRGFGENTGVVDSMNPDKDAVDILAVLDWAQAKLPWLAYGPTLDGRDPHEPIVGAIGGSYGGMYQLLIANADPRHRVRAITPNIAPNDLNYALVPGGAFKSLWNDILWGDGLGNGKQRLDPFITTQFFATDDTLNNTESSYSHDYYAYHSEAYFCGGATASTNGGAGTAPQRPPTTAPPRVNAMIWIGVRDTLFDFNGAYANYQCLKRAGGDVRLLSYQAGHNSIGLDPGSRRHRVLSVRRRQRLAVRFDAQRRCRAVMWFDRYLKNKSGAAAPIPTQPCISLAAGDAVTVPRFRPHTSGHPSTTYDIGTVTTVAGANVDVPAAVALYTATASGAVKPGSRTRRSTSRPWAESQPARPSCSSESDRCTRRIRACGIWSTTS